MSVYVTSKAPIPATYAGPGPVPQQTIYVTTGPAPPPTQTTVVITNPRQRWNQNRHSGPAGVLLFTYGGMDMAASLGWNLQSTVQNTTEMQYSWFIGVIIGAFLASILVNYLPKWFFYCTAGMLQLIDAIICVSAYDDYDAIMASRYVGGIGIGLLTVVYIIHNSEAATRALRGQWCGWEQIGLALGIAVQVILSTQLDTYDGISMICAHGIFGIVFSVLSTAALATMVESPIYYLRRSNEEEAQRCQALLVPNGVNSKAFKTALEDAKRYVEAGNSQSIGTELLASLMPFIKMLFSRCLVAFTISVPLSLSMLVSTVFQQVNWPLILWGILRWLGTVFGVLLLDIAGRKFVSVLGLLCMAGLMLGLAAVSVNFSYLVSYYYTGQAWRLSLSFQAFAGLFVSCTPAYLGEAFPMRIKPFLIGLIVCIEQIIHIVVIVTFGATTDEFYQYFLAVGIILVVSLIIFGVLMPETRGLSLNQATERFTRLHDIKAY